MKKADALAQVDEYIKAINTEDEAARREYLNALVKGRDKDAAFYLQRSAALGVVRMQCDLVKHVIKGET